MAEKKEKRELTEAEKADRARKSAKRNKVVAKALICFEAECSAEERAAVRVEKMRAQARTLNAVLRSGDADLDTIFKAAEKSIK